MRETIHRNGDITVMDFVYDESGKPFAMKYSNDGGNSFTTYYYVLNLQGDVVMMLDQDGNVVAEYAYTAWGQLRSASGRMAFTNPLRYRGYYYDSETGFYYLQSRYYDPSLHRFINADAYASTGQSFIGTNMFAYCNNNPVTQKDASGNIPNHCVMLTDTGGGFGKKLRPATAADSQLMEELMGAFYKSESRNYVIPDGNGTYNVSVSDEYHQQRKSFVSGVAETLGIAAPIAGLLNKSLAATLGSPGGVTLSTLFVAIAKIDDASADPLPTGNYRVYTVTYTYSRNLNLFKRNGETIPKVYIFTETHTFYFKPSTMNLQLVFCFTHAEEQ